jgi:hypothetical protein
MFLGLPNPDPFVTGTVYRSGSGSFHHLAEIVRKTLISTILLLLLDLLYIKIDVTVPSKSNKQKNVKKELIFVGILSTIDEKKKDPDP